MSMTLPELFEQLKRVDEVTLLEILNISAEDLVDRFGDVIEDKFDTLVQDYDN